MEDKIVVYRTYYNPIEASIVKSKLEDAEIQCFLTDENISTIQPLFNQAIGGVKLNVFERDIVLINEILEDNFLAEIEIIANDEKIVCENCKSTNVSYGQATKNRFNWWVTVVSVLLMVYPFKANKCYHCYDCGYEFK